MQAAGAASLGRHPDLLPQRQRRSDDEWAETANNALRGQGDTWDGGITCHSSCNGWPAASGQVYEQPVISLDILPTAVAA